MSELTGNEIVYAAKRSTSRADGPTLRLMIRSLFQISHASL
jgi:hypothetical protein